MEFIKRKFQKNVVELHHLMGDFFTQLRKI